MRPWSELLAEEEESVRPFWWQVVQEEGGDEMERVHTSGGLSFPSSRLHTSECRDPSLGGLLHREANSGARIFERRRA